MKNIKVIVCGPAIGKTYLARHDDRFVDLDDERAKYKYGLFDVSEYELERGKLNRTCVVNDDSSDYIIRRLEEELKKGKIILLSYHEKILNYVISKGMDYCLVYASKEAREEYIERMRTRGNQDNFIESNASEKNWDKLYEKNKNNSTARYKIELEKGKYLKDIVNLFFEEE